MDDLISRQDAVNAISKLSAWHNSEGAWVYQVEALDTLRYMPSAEPEIIYCKDCKRHNVNIGDYREENGKRHWYWKDEACPLVGYRGKAEGHEFDYQFCVCAERRQDG